MREANEEGSGARHLSCTTGYVGGMTLLFKPVSLLLAFFAGKLAVRLFDTIWSWIDPDEAPDAKSVDAPMNKILLASALQGAVTRGTHAAVIRGGARGWERFFGVNPVKPTDYPEPPSPR